MADTTALKNRIRAAIKANDNQEITGPVLQQALLDMVDELDLNPELENEAQQRQNGDSTLQQAINTERQARIDADKKNKKDISILNLLENKYNYTIYSDNNYVSDWGTVVDGGNGKMTTGIILPPGKTITAVCKGYSTNIAILSKVIQEGETYSVLERSIDSTVRAYSYTNSSDYDVNICVSWVGSIDELSVFIEDFNKPGVNNGRFSKNFTSIRIPSRYADGIVKVEAYATAEFLAEIEANTFELITGYYSNNHCFYIQLKKQGTSTLVVDINENVGTAPTGIFEWHYRDFQNRYDIHIIVDCDIITSIQNTGLLLQFADMSFIEQSENGAIQNIQKTNAIDNILTESEIKNTLSPTIADDNAYINAGHVYPGGAAFYTEPINLPNGYTIVARARSYSTNVTIISKVVTAGSSYQTLVQGIDYQIREYSYTNNTGSDIQVAISGLNSGGLEAYTIIKLSTIASKLSTIARIMPSISFDNTIIYPLLNPIVETMDMLGIVKDWGFIGDSLNSGEIYYNRADSTRISGDMYAWSWGQNICQLCRTIGTNFSVGGLTAKSWIQRYWNTSTTGYKTGGGEETFNANPKQVYTICLGTNEINAMINGSMDAEARAAYIGSWDDVDITDFTNNANTFYGNYAGIIQRIKSIQPSAKIFLINIFAMFHNNSIRLEINAAIADIQSHFNNTFLVDMETLVPVTQEIENKYRVWGHLTVQGYMWLSYIIGNIINRIMRDNISLFNSLPFIGVEGKDNGTL